MIIVCHTRYPQRTVIQLVQIGSAVVLNTVETDNLKRTLYLIVEVQMYTIYFKLVFTDMFLKIPA